MVNMLNELRNKKHYEVVLKRYIEKEEDLPEGFSIDSYISMITEYEYNWDIPTLHLIPKDNGKLREIYAFKERDSFMLKVINEILFAKCGHLISKNVFSYTKGVRCYNACKTVQRALRRGNDIVGYKLDLSNYFLSVDKKYILDAVYELVEDEFGRTLLKNFFSINQYLYEGNVHTKELALMPGSAVSSFFANYIPHKIDEYLEKVTFVYARYADDMLIMSKTKEELDTIYQEIIKMYKDIGLSFNESKLEVVTSNSPITFLGLTITKDYIDISKKNSKAIKSFIKRNINRIVKKGNTSSVKNAITFLNKTMLGNIYTQIDNIPHTKLAFIYSNVTTDRTLKELDFYIKDRLRQAYTGKNNSANIRKLPNETLVELGLLSVTQMYYLSKIGKPFLENEMSVLMQNRRVKNLEYKSVIGKVDINPSLLQEFNLDMDFSTFYAHTLNNGSALIIDNEVVYPEYLKFDLDTKTILWRDKVIAVGNKLVTDIIIMYKDVFTKIILKTDTLFAENRAKDSKEVLEALYIVSSYDDVYPMEDTRLERFYETPIQCKKYRFIDLIQYIDAKMLNFDTPYRIRKAKFESYLYFHIMANNLWDGIDYNAGKFINHDFKIFNIVLKGDWLISNKEESTAN